MIVGSYNSTHNAATIRRNDVHELSRLRRRAFVYPCFIWI